MENEEENKSKEEAAEQVEEQQGRHLPEVLKSYQFQKGKSGNPSGRPKGRKSMKQWVKEKLESMDDDERYEFLKGLNKLDIWKMGEGNPDMGEKDPEPPNGATMKLSGVAFLDENGELLMSKQTSEYLKQNGISEDKKSEAVPPSV